VPTTLNVAEAKRRLSELMSRVAYKGERFLIQRRNVPMVALVPADDLARLDQAPGAGRGLLAAIGAWADFDELDELIKDIYRQRGRAKDRQVPIEP
jgi:prevent-host-death family protein